MLQLRDVLEARAYQPLVDKSLVFLSDCQKGLLEGVDHLFPGCPHGYCLRHLAENLHKKFKNPELNKLLWNAAATLMQEKFDEAIDNMKAIHASAVDWLFSHAKPEHWAKIYF